MSVRPRHACCALLLAAATAPAAETARPAQTLPEVQVVETAPLPGIGALYDNTAHQPGANASGTNYIATPTGIYVAYERSCVVLGCRRDGAGVRIEIRDNGSGIPADKQALIFDEFVRLQAEDRLFLMGKRVVVFD